MNCDECTKYQDVNFCGNCGKKIEKRDKPNIYGLSEWPSFMTFTEKLETLFLESIYLDFHVYIKNIEEILPKSITELENKIPESSFCEFFLSPKYHEDMLCLSKNIKLLLDSYEEASVFEKNDKYIIDIKNIKVRCYNDNFIGMIDEVKIYSQEKYEEKYYPFLKYCPNWMEESFKFRKDLGLEDYVPIIDNKFYIISSYFSEILKKYISKLLSTVTRNLTDYNNLNFYDNLLKGNNLMLNEENNIELSKFDISPKNIQFIKDTRYLPIVIAGLIGMDTNLYIKYEEDCYYCEELSSDLFICTCKKHRFYAHKKCYLKYKETDKYGRCYYCHSYPEMIE